MFAIGLGIDKAFLKEQGIELEEERLVKILKLSHSQVLAGKSYSQEEAERYLDDRLYEFRNKMVGTSVAEPC